MYSTSKEMTSYFLHKR